MMYYNFEKHKEFLYLDLFVYLIPISIILGNLIINIVSATCIFIYFFLIYRRKIIYNNYKNYFLVLYSITAFLLLNLIFSKNFQLSFVSILGFFRYYFLFLVILFCLNEIENFEKVFTKIVFVLVLFVIFDVLFQHFFLKDIFGYEINSSHGRRLSGPFGDEKVAGAFISKLFFLASLYIYKINKGIKIILTIIILSAVTIILSNERSSSIIFLTASFVFFIFCNIHFLKKLILFLLTLFSLLFLFNSNTNLKSHFIEVPLKHFQDNHYRAHYLTSYEIFKDHKLIGSGIKTFRYVCGDKKYENIKTKYVSNRCTTHTHNIYLEILSETGIIGITIFTILNFYVLISLIKDYFKKKFLNEITLLLFCNFFILFWPLQTSGSFFSTWNGIFYWIFFSFFFHFKNKLTSESV